MTFMVFLPHSCFRLLWWWMVWETLVTVLLVAVEQRGIEKGQRIQSRYSWFDSVPCLRASFITVNPLISSTGDLCISSTSEGRCSVRLSKPKIVSILHKELERYKWKNVESWSCRSWSSEAVIHLGLSPWWMTFSSTYIILRIILCLIQYLLIEYWSLSFITLVVKDKGKITTKHTSLAHLPLCTLIGPQNFA